MDELTKLKELTEALTDSGYLKDQTDSWKYAFDSVSSFVCIVDLSLKVQFINKAFAKLLDVMPSKLIGTSVVDICKDFLYECSYIENDPGNETQKFGVSYSSSYDKWVDKTKYTIKDDIEHVIGYMFMFEDVTAQKLYEIKLKESERRFKQIIKNVDKISIQGYDEQRRVIFWNEYSEKLYGYTKEEALGKQLEDLIIPNDMRDTVVQLHNAWIDGGPSIPSGELTLIDKYGKDVPVFSSHVINETQEGIEMFCIDISLDNVIIK